MPNLRAVRTTWYWRIRIKAGEEELWAARLETAGVFTWSARHPARGQRVEVTAYFEKKADATRLHQVFGGELVAQDAKLWKNQRPEKPLSIGRGFRIVHDPDYSSANQLAGEKVPTLIIPQGLAFGSGEHGTTLMMLRALVQLGSLAEISVLDLGTGSGILALAAKKQGAKKIAGLDFDPESVRTARENEARNFTTPSIRWAKADVLKMKTPRQGYDLVLANLFSRVLIEAAPQIVSTVNPGGQLWLSGLLHKQEAEVVREYRRLGLKVLSSRKLGKWVLVQGQLARKP